jgi:hypothetical protein
MVAKTRVNKRSYRKREREEEGGGGRTREGGGAPGGEGENLNTQKNMGEGKS